MSQSAKFAFALVILWLAFAAFFVAFHPGGLQINGRPAQNPADVYKYIVQKMAKPPAGGTNGGGTPT